MSSMRWVVWVEACLHTQDRDQVVGEFVPPWPESPSPGPPRRTGTVWHSRAAPGRRSAAQAARPRSLVATTSGHTVEHSRAGAGQSSAEPAKREPCGDNRSVLAFAIGEVATGNSQGVHHLPAQTSSPVPALRSAVHRPGGQARYQGCEIPGRVSGGEEDCPRRGRRGVRTHDCAQGEFLSKGGVQVVWCRGCQLVATGADRGCPFQVNLADFRSRLRGRLRISV